MWIVAIFPCGYSLVSKQRLIKDLPNDVDIIYGFSSYEKAFDYIQKKKLQHLSNNQKWQFC